MTPDHTPISSTTDATPAADSLLQVHSLFCERDERILFSGLSFSVSAGQLIQVLGSNGSGKTTLLRIICGLNDSYEGDILWCGIPVREQREAFLASLLYIGHRVGVNRILTPRENLRWSASLHTPVDDHRIDAALARVGLKAYEDIPCRNLSAGQNQRVSLARLLISPARLWILDEPFTTLDVYGVRELELLLGEHIAEGGSALVTTHHRLNVPCAVERLNLDGVEQPL
ncbi:cytochrome c biogenesis heme-transporting ATPase CcmA [Pseudohongiella sp.]|uniref:ABC transporter domain-containing protein n=1 Tax=marine sediment metagenome TaxID=412755 RepID=A0A0F9WE31_9ZZZZ|nr:cytochrome c biogenesis heme-transporting ATPase CcmA [Pseudohongiella sp.]HDZ09923.1 cytochrome c biogenesis heme-transporting ATPase CcmA [Pseudohongiella sp.]HEA63669.1 cytochrome c biogenesis heme-transporting ATPase CcmA [Pseudohongiella sp.]